MTISKEMKAIHDEIAKELAQTDSEGFSAMSKVVDFTQRKKWNDAVYQSRRVLSNSKMD